MTHQSGFLLNAPRPAEAGRPPWGSNKVAEAHLFERTKRLNPPDTATLRLAVDSQTKPMARGTSERPANIVETDD